MIAKRCASILLLIFISAASAASESQFAIKQAHADSHGVTLQTVSGTMRVEVCGDRVIHVMVSHTFDIPSPKVPIVTQPCRANNVQVDLGNTGARVSTAAVTVTVDTASGAVTFLSRDGKTLLAEPKQGGKSFDRRGRTEHSTRCAVRV